MNKLPNNHENKVILVMIMDSEKWHYFAVKNNLIY